LCFSFATGHAQPEGRAPAPADTGKTRQQLLNELRLSKARVALEKRKNDLISKGREREIARELFNEKIYTLKELNDAQNAYQEAEMLYKQALLDLRQTRLDFLKDATHISVMEAKKYVLPDGRRMVDVTLSNNSNVSEAQTYLSESLSPPSEDNLKAPGPEEADAPTSRERLASLLDIPNIIVSIAQAKGGAIIGKPYDQIVPSLRLGEKKTLTFQLLQEEADQITIQMAYLDVAEAVPVVLEAESSQSIPVVEATQFSQEADLGQSATYALKVERFSSGRAAFQLAVINLPQQITYNFTDAGSNARLSQINFRQNETSHSVSLTVYLPERADERVVMDKPIAFYALALPLSEAGKLEGRRALSDSEVEAVKAGKARLELVPRGVGKIEVRAVNLYHEIKTGEDVSTEITVHNEGTRRLDNIRIRTSLPPGWQSSIQPDVIPALLAAKEEVVRLKFLPPSGVDVGDYEIQIQTQALADNRPVQTQDKTVRIHVSARTNLILSAGLVLLVIGGVVGIVWYGIKLTRR
jgi:hypothetical protein